MEKEEQLLERIEDKMKKSVQEFKQGLIDENQLKASLEPIQKSIDEMKANDNLKEFKEGLNELSKQVALIKTKATSSEIDRNHDLRQSIKEATDELKAKGNYNGFVQLKTAAAITTGNITGQIPQAERVPGIVLVPRQGFTIRNRANVIPVSGTNIVEWVEQTNRDGAATVLAEGQTKPLIDWDWILGSAKVEKIPARIKISREMLSDIDGIMGLIQSELAYSVELAEETQEINGNGVSPQINGIAKYAQTLDLASLAGTVPYPNEWDVLAACITQIRANGKGNFRANAIFMNPVDIFKAVQTNKKTDKDYISPMTMQISPVSGGVPSIFVWGVPVIESDSLTAGQFIVADMTKYVIRDREAFNIEMGYSGDDFEKNMVTIIGEKRLATYAAANHAEAFIKDTFANGEVFLAASS
jgi:HK97 family phage major capsid protein